MVARPKALIDAQTAWVYPVVEERADGGFVVGPGRPQRLSSRELNERYLRAHGLDPLRPEEETWFFRNVGAPDDDDLENADPPSSETATVPTALSDLRTRREYPVEEQLSGGRLVVGG